MFSRLITVLFLSLAVSSSVVRGLPSPHGRDQSQKFSVSNTGTSKKGSVDLNNSSKNDGKGNSTGNNNAGSDPQTSLTLDPSVINLASNSNGMQNITEPGQTPSDVSGNNFINYCIGKGSLTNGTQNPEGSCNPIPMGQIPSKDKMPGTKFVQPPNLSTIKANSNFTIQLAVQNMDLGNFVNADAEYYSAPMKLNAQGECVGHTHVVMQLVDSLSSTKVLETSNFTFFKGLNGQLDPDGTISTTVAGGVPQGVYRLSSITTGANHQMPNGPVAQRGAMDDAVYVTVTDDGNPAGGNNNNGQNTKNSTNTKGNGQDTTGNTGTKGNGQNSKGNTNAKGNGQDATGNKNATGNGQDTTGNKNATGNGQDTTGNKNAKGNGQDTTGNNNAKGNVQDSKNNADGNSKDNGQNSSDDSSCPVDDPASNSTTTSPENKGSKSGSSNNGSK